MTSCIFVRVESQERNSKQMTDMDSINELVNWGAYRNHLKYNYFIHIPGSLPYAVKHQADKMEMFRFIDEILRDKKEELE